MASVRLIFIDQFHKYLLNMQPGTALDTSAVKCSVDLRVWWGRAQGKQSNQSNQKPKVIDMTDVCLQIAVILQHLSIWKDII